MQPRIEYTVLEEQTFSDGQIIFKEGSPGDWVYVIRSGSVEISKTVEGKTYIIEVLQVGEVFGELGFIGGMKRTATAKAVGQTTLGIIDRNIIEKEFNQLSAQFRALLGTVTTRFKKMLERSCDFTRRADPRVHEALSLVFKSREAFLRAYTTNASAGGLFIRTEKPLNAGRQILLKLQLPGVTNVLQIKSEIVWSRTKEEAQPNRPPGMGLKFLEISKSDVQLLKEYLAGKIPMR